MILGSFAVTLILLLLCAGFIAVDLSFDKYMPGNFGSFFEITSLTPRGMAFTVMSNDYHIPFSIGDMDKEFFARLRSLLPAMPSAGAKAAAHAAEMLLEEH